MIYLPDQLVTKDTTTVSRLSERLRKFIADKKMTLREADEHFKIGKSRLGDFLNDKVETAEVETLIRLAHGLSLPIWLVIEDFGIDLGLSQAPSELAKRVANLIETSPEYAPLGPYLLMAHPDDLRGILAFLESQRILRERDQSGGQATA